MPKYPQLPDPPTPSANLSRIFGDPEPGSNDWVDLHLLAALQGDAVDFLVTEDKRLQRAALTVGLGHRVFGVVEAGSALEDLLEVTPPPPPAVRSIKAHALDSKDPILDSFRDDYADFDSWLRRTKLQHRQTWVIPGTGKHVAAFCIVKPENPPEAPTPGKTLKICSFKVAENYNGFRFGELLLKSIFDYADSNRYEWLYVTVFEKYDRLVRLFLDFGFALQTRRTPLGELILAKPLRGPVEAAGEPPLTYHIQYGPSSFRSDVSWYLVPITPRFAAMLFPEAAAQVAMFPGRHAFGNAIRKAYLCHSPIRRLEPGSILAFYRSHEHRGLIAVGIVEETLRSSSPDKIAQLVAKRTVYSLAEIQKMCRRREVLAILFRQARVLASPVHPNTLVEKQVFTRPPQSILSLKGEGLQWLKTLLAQ